MKNSGNFSIRLQGLKEGVHHFAFVIDKHFLATCPQAPREDVDARVSVCMDKQPGLMVLDFHLQGVLKTPCDRCLADIRIPLENQYRLWIKAGDPAADALEEDVLVLHPETPVWDATSVVLESLLLAMPLVRQYDCSAEEVLPCDPAMLARISGESQGQAEQESAKANSPWQVLQKFAESENS